MFNVNMQISNFKREMRRAMLEIDDIADDDINAKMDFANELLRNVTPVDTGFARSRWKVRKYILLPGGEITNDADYIARLNQGSSRQAPAYFIEQALMAARII